MENGPGDTAPGAPGGQEAPPAVVMAEAEELKPYPEHWEADVVLRDGGTCHLRPIGPPDGPRLREFHSRLSAQTVYYRYFAPYPELSDRDVRRFTELDHDSRVALVATVAGEIIAIGSYDRVSPTEAEVAFTVRDDHQGRGLGSVLLEHLAAAARERGIDRFVADVLPGNRKMLTTFAMAGYKVAQEMEEGFVRLAFDLEPTDAQRAVARGREQRAEARSVARLFHPRTVAVIGASRRKDSLGNQLLRSLTAGGFTGRIFAIHPTADEVHGVRAYRSLNETPTAVDLAVVAVPADAVDRVIEDAAAARVHGLIVISSGFAELGEPGAERQRELVAKVRGAGMRLVGPNALGLINTDSRTRLFAALTKEQPRRGRIGVFCQSAAIGTVILERLWSRSLGVSSFVSVGNRGDVASPDAMHYWADDAATSVVALYLDGIANPSKAIRVARDLSRHKPIVVLRAGKVSQAFPLGATVRRTTLPAVGVSQLFDHAGFIDVESLDQLLDVCGLLACQPMPSGNRVAVISDSVELAAVAADSARAYGLMVAVDAVVLSDPLSQLPGALEQALDSKDVDAVVVINSPPGIEPPPDISDLLLKASANATIPIVAVLSLDEDRRLLVAPGPDGSASHGSVPAFGTVEDALRCLGLIAKHRAWLHSPRGEVPDLPDVDTEAARAITDRALARQRDKPSSQRQTRRLSAPAVAEMLGHYGIEVWPSMPVATEDEAVAGADHVGWPVVLKTLDPRLARRVDAGGVRTNLESEDSLRAAYLSMAAQLDSASMAQLVVQRMAPLGVSCALSSVEDPLFGPAVSFSLTGVVTELLGDRAFRVPPITDRDAASLVRDTRGSRLLFGYGGGPTVDVAGLEDLLVRLGRMAEDLPALVRVNLDPVVVAPRTVAVLGASAWVRSPELRIDNEARRLADV